MLKHLVRGSRVLTCALGVFLVAACSTPVGDDGGAKDDSFGDTLTGLGIDTRAIAAKPLMDANGKPLPGNYNPLSGVQVALYRTAEIMVSGWPVAGSAVPGAAVLNPDTMGVLASDAGQARLYGSGFVNKSASGDLDGDGIEETISAIFDTGNGSVVLRRGRKSSRSAAFAFDTALEIADRDRVAPANIDVYRASLALADVDGDGRAEVLLSYHNVLRILDDSTKGFAELVAREYPNPKPGSAQYLRLAAGNFDFDPASELVVVNGAAGYMEGALYWICDDLAADRSLSPMPGSGTSGNLKLNYHYVAFGNVVCGDFNGDKLTDIAVVGPGDLGHEKWVLPHSLDSDSRHAFALRIGLSITDPMGIYKEWTSTLPSLAAGPLLKGQGIEKDLLVIDANVLDCLSQSATAVARYSDNPLVFDAVKVADLTGDDIPETALCEEEKMGYAVSSYGIAVNFNGASSKRLASASLGPSSGEPGSLCLPFTMPTERSSVTSLVLASRGRDVRFTEPRVLAVLASPPYWDGVAQAEGSTCFGTSHSGSTSHSKQFGFSAYVSVGYEQDINLIVKIGSAKVMGKIEGGFDYTMAKSQEVTTSLSWATPSGEDMVVFTCIPYDVYYYEILQANDPADIGKVFTVNSPRKPITTTATVEFYNGRNGEFPDIGADVLRHTRGIPGSYMTYGMARALVGAGGGKGFYTPESGKQTVGAGSGTTTLAREDSSTVSHDYTGSYSVAVEAEANVFGYTAGAGLEFSNSYTYSCSVTDTTFVEGTVGNIAVDQYAGRAFDWGLVSFFVLDKKDHKPRYPVVTYWTD